MEPHELISKIDVSDWDHPCIYTLKQVTFCFEERNWVSGMFMGKLLADLAQKCVGEREARDWGRFLQQLASYAHHHDALSLSCLKQQVEWMLLGKDRKPWNSALICILTGMFVPSITLEMALKAGNLLEESAKEFAFKGDRERWQAALDLLCWLDAQTVDSIPVVYVDAIAIPRT